MDDDEAKEREEALAEVTDPSYLLGNADADAEGEADPDMHEHDAHAGEPIDPLDVLGD